MFKQGKGGQSHGQSGIIQRAEIRARGSQGILHLSHRNFGRIIVSRVYLRGFEKPLINPDYSWQPLQGCFAYIKSPYDKSNLGLTFRGRRFMICRSNKENKEQTHEEITPDFHISHYRYLQSTGSRKRCTGTRATLCLAESLDLGSGATSEGRSSEADPRQALTILMRPFRESWASMLPILTGNPWYRRSTSQGSWDSD